MSCGMCKTTVTPCWREGPNGPRTLCNACGIRWKRDSGTARPRKKKPNQADSPSSPNSGGSPNGTHGSGGAESPSMGGESTPKPKRRVKKIRDRLDPVATPGPREASEKTRASLAASKDSLSHHSGSGGSGSNSYNGYNQNTSVVLSAISKGSSTGAKLLQQVPQETSFLIPHDNGSEYFEMLCEPKHYHSQLQASLDTLSATPGYWIQNPPPSSSSSSSSSSGGRGATMPVPRVPISSPNPFAGPSLLFELHNRKLLEEALDLLQIMNLQQKRNARKVERLLDVVHDPQLLKRAQLVGSVIRHQLRTQKVKYHLRRHLRHSGLHLDSPHLSSSGLSSAVDSFKLLADIADADHLSRRELEILEAELGISSRNTFCPDDYEDDEDEFYDEDEDDDDDDDEEDHVGNGSDLLSGLDSKDAALRSSLAKFLIDDDEEDEEIYYDDDDFYHGDSAKAASSLDDNTDQDLNELATLSSEDSASQPKETEATNQPTDQALLDEDMALASASETQPASVSSSEAQGSQPPIVSKSSSSSSALALDHLPAAKKASGGLELAADKIALQKRQKDDEKAAKARLLQKQKQKQVAAQRRSSPKSQIYTRPSFPALVLAASINSERLSGSPSKQASAPILSPPSPLDLAVSSSSSSLVANEEPSSSSASSSSTLDTEMIASNTL